MSTLQFVTLRENFSPRPTADGLAWEINSDLVAKVQSGNLHFRLVLVAGTLRMRRLPRPSRARATAIRSKLYALPISLRQKDDLFIMALHADKYPHLRRETLKLRVRGYLRRLWKYDSL